MTNKKKAAGRNWYSMDLHLHTPASADYKDPNGTYLDILKRAGARGLDIISFTDHNSVAGYRTMMEEVEKLKLLDSLNRILPDEQARLEEYERWLKKILVLPGFEFTATFGFHILGIFPPEKSVREIEHILLQLNIPADQLDQGSPAVGASAEVLTAYQLIKEAGGLAIAAHANSSNGVAMRGFSFGGQTKIAYTQDPNLHALEVTDLELRGRRTTAAFFSGIKPEYPRRMHCIQGSDAHRLEAESAGSKNLGVGDRVTEVLLPEVSFKGLEELFLSNDFARTRPRRKKKGDSDFDFIRVARDEGSNIVQDFHEAITVRGGKLYSIIADVGAFGNTNGGTLYIGLSNDSKKPVVGVNNPAQAVKQLEKEISNRISPPLQVTVDVHKTDGKNIIRILIPRGEEPPYAVDDNKIYIREEAETGLAVRDEIVSLVKHGKQIQEQSVTPQTAVSASSPISLVPRTEESPKEKKKKKDVLSPPKTGVEIVSVSERNGTMYYTVRDLRNGNVVKNVTMKSARRLWHYAITEYSTLPKDKSKTKAEWRADIGILKKYNLGKKPRYDLAQREKKSLRLYFGVTEDGVHSGWRNLVNGDK